MDDVRLSLETGLRMHHPRLLASSRRSGVPYVAAAFVLATVLASVAGVGGGFVLGSAATLAVLLLLHRADERRLAAQDLVSRVAELTPGRAGIVLRETAGDSRRLAARLGVRG